MDLPLFPRDRFFSTSPMWGIERAYKRDPPQLSRVFRWTLQLCLWYIEVASSPVRNFLVHGFNILSHLVNSHKNVRISNALALKIQAHEIQVLSIDQVSFLQVCQGFTSKNLRNPVSISIINNLIPIVKITVTTFLHNLYAANLETYPAKSGTKPFHKKIYIWHYTKIWGTVLEE